MINKSIRHSRSEPNQISVWEVCKQISRQRGVSSSSVMALQYLLLFMCYVSVEWLVGLLNLITCSVSARCWQDMSDSRGCRQHGNQCWIMLKYTCFPSTTAPYPVSTSQSDCHQQPRDWAFVVVINNHHHNQTSFPGVYRGTLPKEQAWGPWQQECSRLM